MRNLIIASTSTVHGSGYLEYLLPELKLFFDQIDELIFIPYARPGGISYDDYTKTAQNAFSKLNIKVKGIHEFSDQKDAIKKAKALFVGGGNTFELLNQLYKSELIIPLREAISKGLKYLGTSAGSNICGPTMMTTNDMPVVYPPSFNGLNVIPHNINPHYLDPIEGSTHMGETRETRIKEFHVYNAPKVVGLREGSWLEVIDNVITLRGNLRARIFEANKKPIELETGSVISL